MQPFAESNTLAGQNNITQTVTVSMVDDHVVICAPAQLDLVMTETLVLAAASGVASGSMVMIDLDPDTASDELIARRPLNAIAPSCVTGDGTDVRVLGAGYVRLTTSEAYWTIDLAQGRLCRSDHAIEPCFIGPDDWTRVQAIWVTPASVTALTKDGTYLSALTAWASRHRHEFPSLA